MFEDNVGLMGAGMWLFWIFFIVVIIVLLKAVSGTGNAPQPEKSPMEILKARYARGEIDDEEFQHRRHELKQ